VNLLQLIQAFCARTALPRPLTIMATNDAQVVQLRSLLEEVIEDLVSLDWTALVREATFTTVAAEVQGAVKTIAPFGFRSILQDTIYNRSLRLPVYGPLAASKWQARKTLPTTGPFYMYRIREGNLYFSPTPSAGDSCAFEYYSTLAVIPASSTPSATLVADTDTFLLDPKLLLAGLRWKWKSEKGLDYAEDFARYQALLQTTLGADGTKPALSLDLSEGGVSMQPGIFVSPGSWPL
jgi:hypothetical protein